MSKKSMTDLEQGSLYGKVSAGQLMFNLNMLAGMVHHQAVKKGWHSSKETEDAFIERACNNLHDEVSELHEAWRNNRLRKPCDKTEQMQEAGLPVMTCLEEELADIILRALDTAERMGVAIGQAVWSKHMYNRLRAYRHGGKKS